MANIPKRIQRKRTKGWKMPDGAVYVGRPTIYGNPYAVREGASDAERRVAVAKFKEFATQPRIAEMFKRDLQGKDLMCWCRLNQPCHADVLLEIANS